MVNCVNVKKSIVIPVYNRPQYLKILLNSLQRNNLDDWHVTFGIEPGNAQILQLCQKFPRARKTLIRNQTRLGIAQNSFNLLNTAFENGADVVLYLQEDVRVSPDIGKLAEWYAWYCNLYHDTLLMACLGSARGQYVSNHRLPEQLQYQRSFIAIAFVVDRLQWQTLKRAWFNKVRSDGTGFDLSITELLKHPQTLPALAPRYARAIHVGTEGTHVNSAIQKELFAGLQINEHKHKTDYYVQGRIMNVAIVLLTHTLGQMLPAIIETANEGLTKPAVYLFRHSRDPAVTKACEDLAQSEMVVYYAYGHNRGIARSWNEGILHAYADGADVVLVVNDDILFPAGAVDKLAKMAVEHPDKLIIFAQRRYSCFAINKIALEIIGCFDENFFPAYFEDTDYKRRAALVGLTYGQCPGLSIIHAHSGTTDNNPALKQQNDVTMPLNAAYYKRKWGGHRGHEKFTNPFNVSRFSNYIAPNKRHHPYDEYDRTDQNIVKI